MFKNISPLGLLRVVSPIIFLAGAVVLGAMQAESHQYGPLNGMKTPTVHAIKFCFVWFLLPSVVLRFLLLRKPQKFMMALIYAAAIWIGLCLHQQSYNPKLAALDLTGDAPLVGVSLVPIAGPILMSMSLAENVRRRCITEASGIARKTTGKNLFGEDIVSDLIPGESIGIMFAFCVSFLRWRPRRTEGAESA